THRRWPVGAPTEDVPPRRRRDLVEAGGIEAVRRDRRSSRSSTKPWGSVAPDGAPESSGDVSRRRFVTAVTRIRRLVEEARGALVARDSARVAALLDEIACLAELP